MKNKILTFVIIVISAVVTIQAERVGILTEVLKPETMAFNGDTVYVVEKAAFFQFSLKDLKLLNRFGKRGEGPGELAVTPGINNNIVPLADKLFVEGLKKIMFLTSKGELIKETRKKTRIFKTLPLGDNYVMLRMIADSKEKKDYLTVSLFDGKMDLIKNIYRVHFPEGDKGVRMAPDAVHFTVYKDCLYVEKSADGFVIEVYDSQGNTLYTIDKQMPFIKYTKQHFAAGIEELKNDEFLKMVVKNLGGWDNFKKMSTFVSPDYLPPIQDITVQEDKIYVLTFQARENKEKHIIMDLQGNVLQTVFLPLPRKASYVNRALGRDNRFYGYSVDTYYYLLENEESEEWELHTAKLK